MKVSVCMCVFVFLCVLMPTFFTLYSFGPHFAADRIDSVTHFIFFHHFGDSHFTGCLNSFQRIKKTVISQQRTDIGYLL